MRRWIPRTALAAALVVAAGASGCGKKDEAGGGLGATVARVNGSPIHEKDVEGKIDRILALMGPAGVQAKANPEARRQLRSNAIQYLVDEYLIIESAKSENVLPSESDVKGEMEKVKGQYPDPAQFREKLTQLGMTEADVEKEILTNMCIRRLVERLAPTLPAPSSEEARKFYDENIQQFSQPEEIRASHILLASPETDPAEKRAETRGRAEALLSDLRGGRDFGEAATALSADPGSAPNGGDLGFFSRGRMVPQFETAAFALKPGEISDVVETSYGYHVIKVTDRHDARVLPFEEVEAKILENLERSKGDRAIRAILNGARAKAKIEMLEATQAG